MAKISRQVREIINIILFLLVVGVLLFFYVIYPLGQTKVAMGRPDIDKFNEDSLVVNDPVLFEEAGLNCDTFHVEADGLTNIAVVYLTSALNNNAHPKGTVCLLHGDDANRDSLLPLAKIFVDSGYTVIAFDQRATGRSTGKYHGEGGYEASDLEEVIRYLDLRDKISHPLIIVGYQLGADAGILAALEEPRINAVAAIEPYLTTTRWLNTLKAKYDIMWFPFYRTITWWWYNMRSSYASPYRKIDDIKPVACPTLLCVPDSVTTSPEIKRLKELSRDESLTIKPVPKSDIELFQWVKDFIPTSKDTVATSP